MSPFLEQPERLAHRRTAKAQLRAISAWRSTDLMAGRRSGSWSPVTREHRGQARPARSLPGCFARRSAETCAWRSRQPLLPCQESSTRVYGFRTRRAPGGP